MPPEPLPWWRVAAPLAAFLLLALARARWPRPRIVILWRTCLAVIGYAMAQDQISARLSPAYFTVGHPPIVGLRDPTLLGLAWGFLGGFPGGIVLGLALALCATVGAAPPVPPAALRRPLLALVGGMALATLSAGLSAAYNAPVLGLTLGAPWAQLVPPAEQRGFLIVALAHVGTYLGGAIGGVSICGWLVWQRVAWPS